VVSGGADWNTTHNDGVSHVFAKYLLLTDDGEYIAIENEGFIDPKSETTIRTTPTFVANKEGKYKFLNHGVFVGSLRGSPDSEIWWIS
jgi:hypothetical protein